MTNSEFSRLDQIERLLELVGQKTDSNAKAIEALTSDIQEMSKDRKIMYELMQDLTNKISTLTTKQAESYTLMSNLDDRQQQLANQQAQIIEILKKLS